MRREKQAKSTARMKGRPITTEEYERMQAVVQTVVGDQAKAGWGHYLEGLWLSGLRLGESLRLYWDRDDCPNEVCLEVDLTGRRPMMRVPAGLDKGKRDRLLPITPDFAAFLATTEREDRHGPVFNPDPTRRHEATKAHNQRVSKTVARIGRRANVVVNNKGKCASAHDLRRAFGQRWAAKVMPRILMQLMRHAEISTTMKYYAGQDAEAAADVVWATEEAGLGNNSGNNGQQRPDRGIHQVGANTYVE